jgi:dienelactone hydrolase
MPDTAATLEWKLSPITGPIDDPLRIALTGFAAGQPLTLRASLSDARGRKWTSHASFVADAKGALDLTSSAPTSGSYEGIDPEGLIWSLAPLMTDATVPFEGSSISPLAVRLEAEIAGECVASAEVHRQYVTPEVDATVVRERGLVGVLYRPRGKERVPGVMTLGGSSGGLVFAEQTAALLARHGFACLALAYFGAEGLPQHLIRIPLEYFGAALDWLAGQPGVHGAGLGVIGRSRGGELAVLLGSRFSSIRAVVAYTGSGFLWGGLRGDQGVNEPAWTHQGSAVPYIAPEVTPALARQIFGTRPSALAPLFEAGLAGPGVDEAAIPVERTRGNLLLVSGEDDAMWPAARMGDQVMDRLAAHGRAAGSRHLRFAGAGHVLRPPGVPTTVLRGPGLAFGGKPRDQAIADRAAWSATLEFLQSNLT